MTQPTVWHPYSFLNEANDLRFAVIKLNTPFHCESGRKLFESLWRRATVRACTDGAINVLYDCVDSAKEEFLPDFVSGDFDSARPEVLQFFRDKGVCVVSTPDQDETDFTKCVRLLTSKVKKDQIQISAIFVHVSNDDRLDHTMANINTLFFSRGIISIPIYLILQHSVCFLLPEGKHVIHAPSCYQGDWCSLIPVGQPCDNVTTTGLKYNLSNMSMKFGGIVSTSNSFQGETITVDTDQPLLWSSDIRM